MGDDNLEINETIKKYVKRMHCKSVRKVFFPLKYRAYHWVPSEAQTPSRQFEQIDPAPIYGVNHYTCNSDLWTEAKNVLHRHIKFLLRDLGPS